MSFAPSSSNKGTGGRGRGRGRGRGGGRGRGRGRGRSNKSADRSGGNNPNSSNCSSNNNNFSVPSATSNNQSHSLPPMRDEEVLIAFMPYMRGDNQEAMSIHEMYQSTNDQPAFLRAARDFLARTQQPQQTLSSSPKNSGNQSSQSRSPPLNSSAAVAASTPTRENPMSNQNSALSQNRHNNSHILQQQPMPTNNLVQLPPSRDTEASHMDRSMEDQVASLVLDDDDPVISLPPLSQTSSAGSAIGSGVGSSGAGAPFPPNRIFPPNQNHLPPGPFPFQHQQQSCNPNPLPITPPHNLDPGSSMQNSSMSTSPFTSLFPPANTNGNAGQAPLIPRMPSSQPYNSNMPPPAGIAANWSAIPPPGIPQSTTTAAATAVSMMHPMPPSEKPLPPHSQSYLDDNVVKNPIQSMGPVTSNPNNSKPNNTKSSNASVASADTVGTAASEGTSNNTKEKKTPATTKREYQPKRTCTRLDEQPGKLLANNVKPSKGLVIDLRPRQELTAQWVLPLPYLREKAVAEGTSKQSGDPLRNVLKNLSVGLFRRGCTENGAQASIVSKEVISPPQESRKDYPYQVLNNAVVGTVPFYSPRTPGHVVFRMYWQDDPVRTLATGPALNVRVREGDFESSIRFILSNFKGKKVNPTSLSSIHSFSLVLEQFQVDPRRNQQQVQHQLDGAGRAVWGCICEARKVLDACSAEYVKTTERLETLEESVEELKAAILEEEKDNCMAGGDDDEKSKDSGNEPKEDSPLVLELKDKTKALMSGRASCERKWRDSQLAFASILKSIVMNSAMSILLRRELVSKLRLEYELWCPLCEEFAIPSDNPTVKMWYEPLSNLPHTLTADHFRMCAVARSKMQIRILGFEPNTGPLEHVLYPNRRNSRQMNPAAVNVFNQLSTAMGTLYQEVYATEDRIYQQREMIRHQTERIVTMSNCFPPGTKVAVFGSSANGFGSPKSDLDMCLQLPSGFKPESRDDPSGSKLMAELASMLEKNGMKDVDTSRLTARIPVIKFNFPKNTNGATPGEDDLLECDLSMHNPLAVLNTALLRTYADINPVARVLAGVVKRWAKARDINNPARHTLSSYGYILMLLHFLTFHRRSGNGLVVALTDDRERGKGNNNAQKSPQAVPLLPNLQWMEKKWPELPPGSPYMEYADIPKAMMQHPLEPKSAVNTYFYRPNAAALKNLQRLFPGQDLSLGILLASFFRYYAYEFDYKRHVVSLHSTASHGHVEREVKAELDGWRNYSAALTIEDPFETFYDVAHVLRGGYYHRIRREFAVAYSKIADIAMGKRSSSWGDDVDLTKMDGKGLVDWICEPISKDCDEEQQQ